MTQVRKRRTFEVGFKKQIVAQVESGELTISAAARVHEISPTVIQYWRRQYQVGQLFEGPTKRERELERDLERYKRLLAESHAEVDLLKKFDCWKAAQKKLNTSVITGKNLDQLRRDAK